MTEIKRLTLRIRELTANLKKLGPGDSERRASLNREIRELALKRKALRGWPV